MRLTALLSAFVPLPHHPTPPQELEHELRHRRVCPPDGAVPPGHGCGGGVGGLKGGQTGGLRMHMLVWCREYLCLVCIASHPLLPLTALPSTAAAALPSPHTQTCFWAWMPRTSRSLPTSAARWAPAWPTLQSRGRRGQLQHRRPRPRAGAGPNPRLLLPETGRQGRRRWRALPTTTSTATTSPAWWASACRSSLPPQVRSGGSVDAVKGAKLRSCLAPSCAYVPACPSSPHTCACIAGLESPAFLRCEALANEMGLFLQKTNIIRDYLVRPCVGCVVGGWDAAPLLAELLALFLPTHPAHPARRTGGHQRGAAATHVVAPRDLGALRLLAGRPEAAGARGGGGAVREPHGEGAVQGRYRGGTGAVQGRYRGGAGM